MYCESGRKNSILASWFAIAVVLVLGTALMEAKATIIKTELISSNGRSEPLAETDNNLVKNERFKRTVHYWGPDTYFSAHGQRCKSACTSDEVEGGAYFRCKTDKTSNWDWTWDYCSRYRGRDYKDKRCVNECKKRNWDHAYESCDVVQGGWSYCSSH